MYVLILSSDTAWTLTMQQWLQNWLTARGRADAVYFTEPGSMGKGQIYHLALLDLRLDPAAALEQARLLRESSSKTVLFFMAKDVTQLDGAMNFHALRYFIGQPSPQRFTQSMEIAAREIDRNWTRLFLPVDGQERLVESDDILYAERAHRRTIFITRQGRLEVMGSLDSWREKLPQDLFYLVHKSFLVNLRAVCTYSYADLYLADGTHIPIASRKQSAFHRRWLWFQTGV